MRWAQGRAYSLLAGWAGSGSWALGMVVTMRVSVRWREGKGGGGVRVCMRWRGGPSVTWVRGCSHHGGSRVMA